VTPHTNLVLAPGLAKPVKQNGVYASPKGAESVDLAFANILEENSQAPIGASNGPRLRSTPWLSAPADGAPRPPHEDAANTDGTDGNAAPEAAERAQEALYVSSGAALAAAIAFPVTATAAKAGTAASSSDAIGEHKDLADTGARRLKTHRAQPDRAEASVSASQELSPPPATATDDAAAPATGPAAPYIPLSFSSRETKSSADLVDVGASASNDTPLGSSKTAHYPSAEFMTGAQYRKSETSSSSPAIDKITPGPQSRSPSGAPSIKLRSSQTHFAPDPAPALTKSGANFAFQLAAAPITGLHKPSPPADRPPTDRLTVDRTPANSRGAGRMPDRMRSDGMPSDWTPPGKSSTVNLVTAENAEYGLVASDSGTAANEHKPEPVTMPAGTSLADGVRKASASQEKDAAAPLNANEPTDAGDATLQTISTVSKAEKASGPAEPPAPAAAASLKTQPGNAGEDQAPPEKALRQSEVSSAPSSAEPTVQADNATDKAATPPSHAEGSRNNFKRGGAFQESTSQGDGSNGEASRKAPTAPDTAFGVSQTSSAALAMGAAVTGTASPSQQVFDAIRDTLPRASGSSTTASAVLPSSEQPLKVITLALSPANLGTVSIELSLKGDQLGVKVQAEAGAAKLLSQDDGALEKLLKSAGYSLQGISVQIVSHSAQPSATAMQPQPDQNSTSTSTSTGENSGQKQQQRYDGQRAERRQERGQGYGHNQEPGRGGSLYV
jgi:hypothetical protein